jgi:uncharacterized damage-inducible protein DinB
VSNPVDQTLLGAILDSFERGNTILLNLLHTLPEGGLEARAQAQSPTVAAHFAHMHSTRRYFLNDTAPEFASATESLTTKVDDVQVAERDLERIAQQLTASARVICELVRDRVLSSQAIQGEHVTYDHPVLLLQHMLWHEGYHVGQIKLALKSIGFVMTEEQEESTIWGLWRTESWE